MQITEFLKKSGIKYKVTDHEPAFTAQTVAAVEHEPGRYVAKPVIVKADGKYIMCVLPACFKIDLRALKTQLKAKSVELAEEKEIAKICGDCEIGAEAPFGNLYDLPTMMDKTLEGNDHIMFQAGSHEKAIRINMDDYLKLAAPKVLEFSFHMTS